MSKRETIIIIFQVSSESDCLSWPGYTGGRTGWEPRLLKRSHCPVGSALPTLEETAFSPLLPPVHLSARTLQSREARIAAKRPSL